MLFAIFGLGPAELLVLGFLCGFVPVAAALIGVVISLHNKKTDSRRRELARSDDDDDETAIQVRKP